MAITVNSGLKPIQIYFEDRDEYATIKFNPTDTGLVTRFADMEKNINEKLKDVKDIELDADGQPIKEEFVEQMKQVNKIMFEELNRCFGNDISTEAFKFCDPLATVGEGEDETYYILLLMQGLADEIETAANLRNKNMDKYLNKYKK